MQLKFPDSTTIEIKNTWFDEKFPDREEMSYEELVNFIEKLDRTEFESSLEILRESLSQHFKKNEADLQANKDSLELVSIIAKLKASLVWNKNEFTRLELSYPTRITPLIFRTRLASAEATAAVALASGDCVDLGSGPSFYGPCDLAAMDALLGGGPTACTPYGDFTARTFTSSDELEEKLNKDTFSTFTSPPPPSPCSPSP